MQNFAEFPYLPFLLPFFLFYFYVFGGTFTQCILCSLPVTGAIFIRQKAKVSELLSGSNCCSLCHLTTVSMLQLPLYLLLTPLLSVLLSLLVICTKYSRPGSKCGCTSRPSTSCYSPKSSSSSPGSILNSMCTFSAKSNEIFAACD